MAPRRQDESIRLARFMLAPYNRAMKRQASAENRQPSGWRVDAAGWLQWVAQSTVVALALAGLTAGCSRAAEPSPEPSPESRGGDDALLPQRPSTPPGDAPPPPKSPTGLAFDGQRAYEYLKAICALGPRYSGSAGMRKQQELLSEHFAKLGGAVSTQQFSGTLDPRTRRPVPMANLIVTWHPEAKERILLCAHYDTRPLPDQDRDPQKRRNGVFLGANDGASGVAALMELAHHVPQSPAKLGVDFVLFDAEEYVFDDQRDQYFLGSRHFAQQYRRRPPPHRYVAGVLLDMVADARLSVYQEQHSVSWPDTRPIVKEIWSTAQRLGVREFIPRARYIVRDDHVPLHEIARIPVCDVIDFRYPDAANSYWHTTADVPENCSADSIGKVGRVVLAWLESRL